MSKCIISFMLVAILFLVPLAAFIGPDVGFLESERRHSTDFPEIPSKIRARSVKKYFKGIDAFFTDHLPLRSSMLQLTMKLNEASNDSLDISKCYRGRENWLFLGNSYARCVDKLQGSISLSDDTLKRHIDAYTYIRDVTKKFEIDFFVLIGPNKSTIYPEYLPPLIHPATTRYIAPLYDALKREGINVYDPKDRILAAKASDLFYYRTDTHWNYKGTYEAFEGWREWAGLPPLPPFTFNEASIHYGDLLSIGGYDIFPVSVGDNFELHWSVPPPVNDNDGFVSNADATSEKTVWVFGDSFSYALRPYIIATFREARFFKHGDFETAMSSQFNKPDAILWVIVERSFAE